MVVKIAILGRFLGAESFGIYTLVVSYVELVNQFVDLRVMDMATSYASRFFGELDNERGISIFKLSYFIDFTTGVLAFVIVFFSASFAANLVIHEPGAKILIQIYAVTLLISTVDGTNAAVLRVFEKFNWIAVYNSAMAFIEIILILIAVFSGFGLTGVFLLLIFKDIISAVSNSILANKIIKQRVSNNSVFRNGRLELITSEFRNIARFLWHTNVIRYSRLLSTKVDVLILGFFHSSTLVGIYKLSLSIAKTILMVTDPFVTTLLPNFSRLWAQKRDLEFNRLLRNSIILAGFTALILGVGVSLTRDWLLLLFGGQEYLPGNIVTTIAAWGFVIQGIFFWLSPLSMSTGKVNLYSRGIILLGIIQGTLSFILIPLLGITGGAWSLLLANLVAQPVTAYWIMRKTEPNRAAIPT